MTDLPTNKAAGGEIRVNVLKNSNVCFDELTTCINYALINGKFPNTLKNANVTPIHKKNDPTDKINFSVLPLLSKVFKRVIYKQLCKYMESFLNKQFYGFRKFHSSQNVFFKLLQRCRKELNNSGLVRAILMDLLKTYDCLPHDLIIAKFEAYGLSKTSLSLLLDFLTSRKQKVKVGSSYSMWSEIKRAVPQEFI